MKRVILSTRVEDDSYFQGPFWLIADSLQSILDGQFELIGYRFMSNYAGEYVDKDKDVGKCEKRHVYIWKKDFAEKYHQPDYTYYPRGRVAINDGRAYIHINSRVNTEKVIDEIIKTYEIGKLKLQIDENDVYQGSHYEFKLP